MDDIFVGQLMTDDVVTASPDTLVEDAANTMLSAGVGSLVVVSDGRLAGILTTTDFVRIVAERKPKDETPVSQYMTTDVVTVAAGTAIGTAADVLLDHGIHHVPVVDGDDVVVGMVSTTDLAAYLSTTTDPSVGRPL